MHVGAGGLTAARLGTGFEASGGSAAPSHARVTRCHGQQQDGEWCNRDRTHQVPHGDLPTLLAGVAGVIGRDLLIHWVFAVGVCPYVSRVATHEFVDRRRRGMRGDLVPHLLWRPTGTETASTHRPAKLARTTSTVTVVQRPLVPVTRPPCRWTMKVRTGKSEDLVKMRGREQGRDVRRALGSGDVCPQCDIAEVPEGVAYGAAGKPSIHGCPNALQPPTGVHEVAVL